MNRFFVNQKKAIINCKVLLFGVLFISVLSMPLNAQVLKNSNITLKVKNESIANVFKKVTQLTGYNFFYDEVIVKDAPSVSLDYSKTNLKTVLDDITRQTNLNFVISENTITVGKNRNKLSKDPIKIRISGAVYDAQKLPLIGVPVVEKGTLNASMTDENGYFSLEVATDATLSLRYLGYENKEVRITENSKNISITLKEDTKLLDEVVVVGYGTQKRVNLTGAVGIITSKDIAVKPVGQTSSALQGLLPGVTVKQTSGQPGNDGASIRIRGIGTLNDSNPLVMIDGVEGSMNNIDPNMIESISVLKDAASASIYGSRAANGVILVTTKRGAVGKYRLSYNNYVGWQQATDLPKMVDALGHMELINIAYQNVGRAPLYSEDLVEAYRSQNGVSSDEYPNTDWQKRTLTGSGFQQSHFINISGGSQNLKTSTSIGFFEQDGLIENTSFRRLSLRNNMDWHISSKFSVKLDLQFVSPRTTTPSTSPGDLFLWTNGLPANQPAVNSNGTWAQGWNGSNPIAHAMESGTKVTKTNWGSINATAIYKPVDWITIEGNIAPKYVNHDAKAITKPIQTYFPDGTPSFKNPIKSSLAQSHNTEMYNNIRATITAEKSFSDHTVKVMAGYSQEDFKTEGFSASRDSINVDFPMLPTGGVTTKDNSGSATEWALQSVYGRLNYDYKQKYLFEFNLRYDGSSRFARENRFSLFPSLSAGWRITEEDFMQKTKSVLSDLKIRASWGKLGNQNIGNYPYISQIAFGQTAMDGSIVSLAALNAMANKLIKWESTTSFDVGIDLMLFDKLTITADYYTRKTDDILLKLDIPHIIGLDPPYQNAGVVENKGWELAVGYRNKIGDLKYNFNFNISDVKNKILDLRGQDGTGLVANREGYAINSLYGYVSEGYFQNDEEVANSAKQFGTVKPGDIKYRNINDADNAINLEDKEVIGSTIPRYTYGINIGFEYKGFDLGAFFQGVGKADGYLHGAGIWPFATTGAVGGTIREDNRDFWTEDNRNAKYPRLAFGATNNEQHSSFWLQDASYFRLKNLQIGYNVPKKVLHKIHIEKLRIFANGTNLFSIDNFLDGYNVEAPISTGNFYPQTRLYSFGLELTF